MAEKKNRILGEENVQPNDDEVLRPHILGRGPVFDSEWQGGVVLRKGRKTMHFPEDKKDNSEEDFQYKKAA